MRLSRPALALPAGALLLVLVTGCTAAAPQRGVVHPVASPAATIAPVHDSTCSGVARTAVARAEAGGAALATLPGRSFKGKAASVGTKAVVLPAGTTMTADFTAGKDRIDSARVGAASAGLVGAGRTRSTVKLATDSSTRKQAVPTKLYEVNPLNVLRVSSSRAVVGGFTLQATKQGHTFNGLRIERSSQPRVADLAVKGVRGDMDKPPGETFAINDYKTSGALYEHVLVDGQGVGGAEFGANGSKDMTLCDVTARGSSISMGFAFWTVRNISLTDCVAEHDDYVGFNFERVSGTVKLVRPKVADNRWDMRVVSDLGSAKYTIVDPDLTHTRVPGTWTVAMPSTYYGHPLTQRRSDIRLIIHGKSRPDLLRLVKQY